MTGLKYRNNPNHMRTSKTRGLVFLDESGHGHFIKESVFYTRAARGPFSRREWLKSRFPDGSGKKAVF
jgi:hypothetical protein